MLLRFKQFEATKTFVPKRIKGRDEEAEEKGVNNYLKMAQKGKFKNLDWEFDESYARNADFDAKTDPRISLYCASYEPIEGESLTMGLSYQYEDYLRDPTKGRYQLQISDPFGADFFEQYDTFEEGLIKLEEYIGRKPHFIKVK